MRVAPEAGGHTCRDYFEGPATSIASFTRRIDFSNHASLDFRLHAADRGVVRKGGGFVECDYTRGREGGLADAKYMACHTDAGNTEEVLCDSAGSDTRRRLTRARTLENIPDVPAAVLRNPGKIRMAGAWACHR